MCDSVIHEEEKIEAKKFDKRAKDLVDQCENMRMGEDAWKKFDRPVPPSDPYNYSIQALGNLSSKILLEIGCGTGWLSVILAKRGATVHGIDISPKSVSVASVNAKIHDVSKSIHFRVMSGHKLDYEEDFFDLVYGLSILHHVNIDDMVREVWRVLKPGGRAIFMEPFGNSQLFQSIRKYIPIPIDDDIKHPRPPLRYKDLIPFHILFFKCKVTEFQLLMRLERITSSQRFLDVLAKVDEWILRKLPFFRAYARHIVIQVEKC